MLDEVADCVYELDNTSSFVNSCATFVQIFLKEKKFKHNNAKHDSYVLVKTRNSKSSDAGNRTRATRVRAEYPNRLDYIGDITLCYSTGAVVRSVNSSFTCALNNGATFDAMRCV